MDSNNLNERCNEKMHEKNLLTIENFKPVSEEFDKLYSYAKDTIKLQLNKDELNNIYNCLKKNPNGSVIIALFDAPSSGKSSIRNFFITGSYNGPLPKSAAMGPGCTRKSIRCSFNDSKIYNVYALCKYSRKNFEKSLFVFMLNFLTS